MERTPLQRLQVAPDTESPAADIPSDACLGPAYGLFAPVLNSYHSAAFCLALHFRLYLDILSTFVLVRYTVEPLKSELAITETSAMRDTPTSPAETVKAEVKSFSYAITKLQKLTPRANRR